MIKQVPNFFTLLNLVFGCLAIVAAMQHAISIQYNAEGAQYIDLPENLVLASVYIVIAAVIDFLDGFVARLFKATSELGKQLDSLADVVSFGVAPAMILYQFLHMGFAKAENGLETSSLWLVPAFLFAMAAAYRLGRFNLDASQAYGFKGVPVPAAGIMVASLPLIYWHTSSPAIINLLLNVWVIYALIVVLSLLMVSKLPLLAMKFKDKTIKGNMPFLLLGAIAILSGLFLRWMAVPITFVAYIILSLAFKKSSP